MLSNIAVVFRRELGSYFGSPLAYIFIVVFLVALGAMTFFASQFLVRGQATLGSFFMLHPWIYLFFLPALAMRLWAEERRTGTIELLLTLPIRTGAAMIGKVLAAWAFTAIALILTFPLWATVNYLGNPDNGVILASYIGSLLMAGAYLSMGAFVSAFTKNQVIAFILGVAVCFLFTVSGAPILLEFFTDWASTSVIATLRSFSVLGHFQAITRGVIDARDLIYFLSLITFFLFAGTGIIERRKAQ
ncbi:MAG: ABC transporter permease [Alphaproteobacteria bacterium]